MKTRRVSLRDPGFSLVELLVSLAVVAVLATILLVSISSVKQKAREAVCQNNLRQLGVAILVYSNDHGGYAPQSQSPSTTRSKGTSDWCDWVYQLKSGGYVDGYDVFYCPDDMHSRFYDAGEDVVEVSYGINESLSRSTFGGVYGKLGYASRPEVMPLLADASVPVITGYSPGFRSRVANANGLGFGPGNEPDPNLKRHAGGSLVCFVDGHVEMVDQSRAMYGFLNGKFNYTSSDWW